MQQLELWDIYDENKQKTGRLMKRNDWNMKPGDYHLSVLGIVTDLHGNYLITKRKVDKQWAPGSWEVSGGGVKAGETSLDAVKREVAEETGLDTKNAMISFLTSYKSENTQEKNNYIVDIYHLIMNFSVADVHAQESETDGFDICDFDRIRELGEAGKFLHYKRLLPAFAAIAHGM